MSKKRFSSGLDDLFKDDMPVEEAAGNSTSIYSSGTATIKALDRKTGSKNFVSDLDALLQEAIDESFEKFEARQQQLGSISPGKTKSTASSGMPQRSVLTGLDALIRQTIDVKDIVEDEMGKKRLTVTVDKPKLDKLKTIARMENSFLKDILVGLIDGYINDYSNKKGIEL